MHFGSGSLHVPLLDENTLVQIGAQLMYWPAKAGPLLRRGETSRYVYLLRRGAGFVTYRATPAAEVMVGVLRPGDWIGQDQALSLEPLSVEARVIVTSELLRVEKHRWLDACSADTELSLGLLAQSTGRQQEIMRRMSSCLVDPIEERLPRMLWDLCEPLWHQNGAGAAGVQIPLTQDTLSRMAGCTRVTLHRGLNAMTRLGLLRLKRGAIEVPVPEQLARFSGGMPATVPRPQPGIA
jgi:CRP-like cAMP-binding protein